MKKKFATVITCMDGRIQMPVHTFMKNKYHFLYVDTITEAGPCKIIAENKETNIINNIKNRLDVSISKHHSKTIAVVGHHDCAALDDSDQEQKTLIREAAIIIKKWVKNVEVIPLWVNESFDVEELK